MKIEEKCICGAIIPRGYGYYNYGKPLVCLLCGKVNQRSHIETIKEFKSKIQEKPKNEK